MQHRFTTSFGEFSITWDGEYITGLQFPAAIADGPPAPGGGDHPLPLVRQAVREITEYFTGERTRFTVPVKPAGTAFQSTVWEYLTAIPYGEVKTYGDIARYLGAPGAARAVGLACAANPIPLLIPCHRVVGRNGKLVGFSGGGVAVKQRLLELEGAWPLRERSFDPSGSLFNRKGVTLPVSAPFRHYTQ